MSRIKWLFVIARNSSFTYKGVAVDVKQVGRELGVRYVLEGSVRKAGNRVRIYRPAGRGGDRRPGLGRALRPPLDDIFALQDEIALNVVGAIEPSLRRAEIERVKRKRPDSLDAYDLVLAGAAGRLFRHAGASDARRLCFSSARSRSIPTYALAHANAAMCHHCLFLRAGLQEENRLGLDQPRPSCHRRTARTTRSL